MSKNSFVIMESWSKTLMCAPTEQAGKLIQLLCRYNATGDDSCDDPMVSAVFAGWKAQIDANNDAYEAKVEGARKAREKKTDNKVNQGLIAVDIKTNQKDIKNDIKGDNDNVYVYDNVSSNEDNISIVEQARPSIESDIDVIIDYLNKATQSNFKKTTEAYRKAIRARLNDKYTLDDFKRVIDSRVALWGNDERMREYLRPQTLFAPSHFDSYLNEANRPRPSNIPNKPPQTGGMQKDNPFNNFEQHKYTDDELDELERLLTVN